MKKSLIIIGAGTAGLAAGCYAQMNGFQTTVFEMHKKPGGLCTSWKRGNYFFDGSVAGLAGSAPGSPLYRLWQELGVANYCPLHYGGNFGYIHHPDGRCVTIFADINRLENHLMEMFPAETLIINRFAKAIRSVLAVDPPFVSQEGWKGFCERLSSAATSAKAAPALVKYINISIREFSEQAKDPFLQAVFQNIAHFGGLDVPLLTILLPLAYAHRKMAGIPAKGWLSFAQAIERRYLELGGNVVYRSKVDRLSLDRKQVNGVILSDGTMQPAELVLSTADGYFSNFILPGKHDTLGKTRYLPENVSDQPMQINLGVAMDLSDNQGPTTFLLWKPFISGGKTHQKMTMHNKYYDPEAAPAGKSAVTVFLDSSYAWWMNISKDPERYQTEKEVAAEHVINAIEERYPGFKSKVEVIDVSTPLTRERYTGNWLGAMQAFKPDANLLRALISGKPNYAFDGIKGYYLAGQWMEAWGGITTAAQSARKAVAVICKDNGRRFKTTVP